LKKALLGIGMHILEFKAQNEKERMYCLGFRKKSTFEFSLSRCVSLVELSGFYLVCCKLQYGFIAIPGSSKRRGLC